MKIGKFYLIAGAFGVKSNATNTVKKFKAAGLDASLAKGPNELNYVVVGESNTQEEIDSIKKRILSSHYVDAWVYHKN